MGLDLSPKKARGIWKVEMHGHPFDLEDLAAALGDSGSVERVRDKWFLTSSEIGPATAAPRELMQAAGKVVEGPIAVLTAEATSFRGVTLGGLIFERADGGNNFTLAIEPGVVEVRGAAIGRARAVAVGGTPLPDPRVKRARLYATDAVVRRAVDFINKTDDTFASIYKAFEVVREDLGGEKEIATLTGIPAARLSAFRENANRSALSGDKARHATSDGRPVTTPRMSVEEGREMVRHVILAWTDTKG